MWWLSFLAIFLLVPIAAVAAWYLWFYTSKWTTLINRIPGPKPWPIVGNALDLVGGHKVILNAFSKKWVSAYGDIYRIFIGFRPNVVVTSPELLEPIFNSTKLIEKGHIYDLMRPWLGDSLLMSSGQKWKARRRLFTPAFHFKVLEGFVGAINEHSQILCSKLQQLCPETRDIDIYPLATACTLDIICETAMGCKIDAQLKYSEYANAVHRISQIIIERYSNPWLQADCIFALTAIGREHSRCLKILHNFTDNVIRHRRSQFLEQLKNGQEPSNIGTRTRRAFLDLLLEAVTTGAPLSDQDIREEVDIFMFGGHDTTSSAISWFLYAMACNPEHQDKVREELDDIFDDSDRPCTHQDVASMKYLDCCLKESMRIYSPGPFITRTFAEPVNIGEYCIPAGCDLIILIHGLHNNPKYFPEPDVFKPERFFVENCLGRHPYAYVPFSAGTRNCIGQKFALMELKIVLSTLLRKLQFKLPPGAKKPEPSYQLILKPVDGINLEVSRR
nr:CYP4AP6 protein [Diaphanosoma celebensis]